MNAKLEAKFRTLDMLQLDCGPLYEPATVRDAAQDMVRDWMKRRSILSDVSTEPLLLRPPP